MQIVHDLGALRELAEALLRYDAVTFLQLLDTLRLSEGCAAVWLLHPAAHTIFDYVRPLPSPPRPAQSALSAKCARSPAHSSARARDANLLPGSATRSQMRPLLMLVA